MTTSSTATGPQRATAGVFQRPWRILGSRPLYCGQRRMLTGFAMADLRWDCLSGLSTAWPLASWPFWPPALAAARMPFWPLTADADPASSTRLRSKQHKVAWPASQPPNQQTKAITSWATALRSWPPPSPSNSIVFHYCLSFCSDTSSQAVYCCRSRRLLKNRIVIADIGRE